VLHVDENALSRELIGDLLEGSGQVAEKFGFQQIFWYRTTLSAPPTFARNFEKGGEALAYEQAHPDHTPHQPSVAMHV
jgi:hypothetical protein